MTAMDRLPRGTTLDLFAEVEAAAPRPPAGETAQTAQTAVGGPAPARRPGDDPPAATNAERRTLDVPGGTDAIWRAVAAELAGWFAASDVSWRDAVVLVPFVQLIDPLRRALAAPAGGWLPRVETPRTLAESLGPPPPVDPGAPTRVPALDRLLARRLLLGQAWCVEWARRDGLGFDQAVGRLVTTVHELLDAMAARPPAARDAAWQALRAALPPSGQRERDLALVAVHWAATAPPPRTDALYALQPAGWISLEAGGSDPLAAAVLAAASVPTLTLVLDPPADGPLRWPSGRVLPRLGRCPGFEDEAQAAAAEVLAELAAGHRPVALIAQDRLVVRRTHELLLRSGVRVVDETGWRVSTTRAAAGFMALLRSARGDAGNDDLLDWLKSGTRWATHDRHAVAALEARIRSSGATRIGGLAQLALRHPLAERLRDEALAVLAPLRSVGAATLDAWLAVTVSALAASGGLARLEADAAGRVLLHALLLDLDAAERQARLAAIADLRLTLAEFSRWCDEALEQATFRPERQDAEADVHVTPLARAMLRPFAAAVLPGADARLGAWPMPEGLLPRRAADALGLPSPEDRQRREALAFAHLLRIAPLTLLRRERDGSEPMAPSRLVERLRLALAAEGRAIADWVDPRRDVAIPPQPARRAEARAPTLMPERVSATALEALRACPYRFFGRVMLRLTVAEEIEGELDKRDWGTWLHEVLLRFHQQRTPGAAGDDEAATLHAVADAVREEHGLDAADFLPWQASFDAFVPRYVAFARERDAAGALWHAGEQSYTLALPEVGVELYGIVDRIDAVHDADGPVLELIDYKAGGQTRWKDQSRLGFEDTQLAFYGALVHAATGQRVRAGYLPLEARDGLRVEWHDGVQDSAAALVEGVVVDVTRLRGGAGLRALGEGSGCSWCDVRGLCRRDDWHADDAVARDAAEGAAPGGGGPATPGSA